MTNVEVDAGVCGYATSVAVERLDSERVRVHIESDCPQVLEMAKALGATVEWKPALRRMCDSPVYAAGSASLRHATCPVPMAVLKAIEAEVGAAVPGDVAVTFRRARS